MKALKRRCITEKSILGLQPRRLDLVLYPEEGSIAETSVKTLLNSVDFTVFNLTLNSYAVQRI